CMQALELPLTF
nr:immunoglobulin light chain junction region [Macaca mulatta]MOV37031.1 immunoglobulin light chain junction region [Macaca mulatta]MOV37060.1 immunoglobulin light chain junction region [Macaca mulatta]MOV37226.1 immunoglobulin light chain junction region [Macaca mulatta]MOV37367.1 immunoglobulin light chain junction region [Macaca mulatta]